MSLLSRISVPETWPEIERAAEERFWDGYTLATTGPERSLGAMYLLGYVIEMLLKTAFFRVRGIPRHADTTSERNAARRLAAAYGRPRNDHDLNYWVFALERARAAASRPLDPAFMGALTLWVSTVASHWTESLRYRAVGPMETELYDVLNGVEWVFERRSQLWS